MEVGKVIFIVTLTLCLKVIIGQQDKENNAFIQEVDIGKNAVLKCRSNDETHVFLFWHNQKQGVVIGPLDKFDETKYNFEVVSGNLTIRATTLEDEGLYNCVSDGLDNKEYFVSSVKLIIHRDWEEVYETDSDVNLMRACAALAIILGMLIIVYTVMKLRQQKRDYIHFGEDELEEEDDSTEELFNRGPSTSGHKKIVPNDNKSPDDFEKVYTTINMTDTV